jgi:hypothetical protein
MLATIPKARTPDGAARVENFDTRLSAATEEALRAVDANIALSLSRMWVTRVGHES